MKQTLLIPFFLLLVCGCSKPVSDPPRIRTGLVVDILESSSRGNHAEVLTKVRKLKDIDQTNVFLSELESTAHSNLELDRAEELLRHGNRSEAEKILAAAITRIGPEPALIEAKKTIAALSIMESLIPNLKQERSAEELRRTASAFLKEAEKIKNTEKLRKYALLRLKHVTVLEEKERQNAKFDLMAEFEMLPFGTDEALKEAISAEIAREIEH